MSPDHREESEKSGEEIQPARRLSGIPLPIFEPEGVGVLDSGSDSDEIETEDESLLESIEQEPRTVLITGACGNIGRKLRSAWADVYDLILIDRVDDRDDPDVITAD